jgi:adenylate kinase
VAGRCDRCGAEIVQRKDDGEDVVQTRLDAYANQTAAALPILRAVATVHDIDGVGAVDEIRGRIFRALALR